jgi:hypothetical protein
MSRNLSQFHHATYLKKILWCIVISSDLVKQRG